MATPKQASSATQNANLRSMSDTRKAKFKRLLEQQVYNSLTLGKYILCISFVQ